MFVVVVSNSGRNLEILMFFFGVGGIDIVSIPSILNRPERLSKYYIISTWFFEHHLGTLFHPPTHSHPLLSPLCFALL